MITDFPPCFEPNGRFCTHAPIVDRYTKRMSQNLTLYYAPDNASLCVRLALLEAGIMFETVLVDRKAQQQRSAAYLAMNPMGLIPVLVTPNGPLYETGAILLWIADHVGDLIPAPENPARGGALKWLFWMSNTLHPALRMLFYPDQYIDTDSEALRHRTQTRLITYLDQLEANAEWLGQADTGILGCYLAPMLRWMAIYGGDTSWFDITRWPGLLSFAQNYETGCAATLAATAEGLGPTPFSAPSLPNPPEGSAT